MNDLIWFLIGIVIIGCIGVAVYKWKYGKLPSQIDRDGDGKVF